MNKQRTLENLFEKLEIEDVLDNAEIMGYNPDKRLDRLEKPELIRKELAKAILAEPEIVLRKLPYEDLMLLRILQNAEPNVGMSMHATSQIMSMAMMGLAEQVPTDKDGSMEIVSITEDFKDAIRPCLEEVLNDIEVKLRLLLEEYLIGALNLYGVLTKSELKTILKECYDLSDDGNGLFDHIYPNSLALLIQEFDGTLYDVEEDIYVSPFINSISYVVWEREKHTDTSTLKHFDRDTLRAAGQMPVPTIPNRFNQKLLSTLQTKLGYSEEEALFQRFLMWQKVQNDANIVNIVKDIVENASQRPRSMNELNDVVQVLTEFLNNAPRWIFRGRCPNDLQQPLTSAPSITLGPNMQNMGFRQEDVQQWANNAWAGSSFYPGAATPYAQTNKIGRNDPCPCGSGKKFKNCCGKN